MAKICQSKGMNYLPQTGCAGAEGVRDRRLSLGRVTVLRARLFECLQIVVEACGQ